MKRRKWPLALQVQVSTCSACKRSTQSWTRPNCDAKAQDPAIE